MILEPVVWVILHCDRCNFPYTDEDDNPVGWHGEHAITKVFDQYPDVSGWRRFGDRHICEPCQVETGGTATKPGTFSENPEPFRAIDAALVARAQSLYDVGMLEILSPSTVLGWVKGQPESALRDALRSALEAAFQDGLNGWGPAAGSKDEGAYERAFSVFNAIECELRPSIAATVMGGAE